MNFKNIYAVLWAFFAFTICFTMEQYDPDLDEMCQGWILTEKDSAFISNMTPVPLYAALYLVQPDRQANLYKQSVTILPKSTNNVVIPQHIAGKPYLVITKINNFFAQNAWAPNFDLFPKTFPIGIKEILVPFNPNDLIFIATEKENQLHLFSEKEYDAALQQSAEFTGWKSRFLAQALPKASQAQPSSVIHGPFIHPDEQRFIQNRKSHTKSSLKKFLDMAENLDILDKGMISIALVFPGGGSRARNYTLGYLKGAQKIGLLDCTLYMTGLSGSTWALMPWVQSGKSLDDFISWTKQQVMSQPNPITDWRDYSSAKLVYESQQFQPPYTFGNVMGAFGETLASKFLSGDAYQRQTTTLSDLQKNLTNPTRYPLPIGTAIHTPDGYDYKMSALTPPTWFEFSPYATGTHQHGGFWIDTRLLGSRFEYGTVKNIAPELPLGYLMGLWGSAPSVSLDEARSFAGVAQQWLPYSIIPESVKEMCGTHITGVYFSPQIPNFMRRMQDGIEALSPLLKIRDGGHDMVFYESAQRRVKEQHNFSDIPILQRNIDVIIMCDAGQDGAKQGSHLKASASRAENLKLPFPEIRYSTIQDTVAYSFGEEDLNTPVIIYMSVGPNHNAYAGTLNFVFEPSQFDTMVNTAAQVMEQNKDIIKQALFKASLKKLKKIIAASQKVRENF